MLSLYPNARDIYLLLALFFLLFLFISAPTAACFKLDFPPEFVQ